MDPSLLLTAGQGLDAKYTDLQNQFLNLGSQFMQQRYNTKMYNRQRADALSFWNQQNEYNSPASQVSRLRAAGLNPALAYGGSNSGSPIQVPDIQAMEWRSPRPEGAQRLDPLLFADLRIKNAQANNLETQTEVIRQDARLRNIQAARGELDYNLESGLYSVNADARREGLRRLQIENQVSLNRDAREALTNASSLSEALERMVSMRDQRFTNAVSRAHSQADIARLRAERDRIRQSIELMKKEGVVKDWEVELSKRNLRPGDPMWVRMLTDILTGMLGDIPSEMKGFPGPKY